MKSWANFLKNEIMNKEDIYAGQEGKENQREKPAGCLWPLLWLILCLPTVPIVVYTLFILLMSYYIKTPVWFLALFQALPILAGSTGWIVFFMHVAKGRAKNAAPLLAWPVGRFIDHLCPGLCHIVNAAFFAVTEFRVTECRHECMCLISKRAFHAAGMAFGPLPGIGPQLKQRRRFAARAF